MLELEPKKLVPGHGPVTTAEQASKDTRDYLRFLRDSIHDFMEQGGGIENVGLVDQNTYRYLENFDQLKGRNAQRVFEELEWE